MIGQQNTLLYLVLAADSSSRPQIVVPYLNLLILRWKIDIIRLRDGDAGLVWQALLKPEAVILPVCIVNHTHAFTFPLVIAFVLASTSLASSGVRRFPHFSLL